MKSQANCAGHAQLVNVPAPEFYEAASSWLSRLALSQGTSVQELFAFLGLINRGDVDRQLYGESLKVLRTACGLPETALAIHERVMVGLESIGDVGAKYLATSPSQRPRFRYCPLCLAEMHTPHFQIHWRFIAWRWCPDHDCLLEDDCPHCGGAIIFPTDIAESAAGRMGHGFLSRCQSCGARLTDIDPCNLRVDGFRRVSDLENMSLTNGRALLATLYYGRFRFKGESKWRHPKMFKIVERYGVLPVRMDWLRPALVRQRTRETYFPEQGRWLEGRSRIGK